LAVRAAPTARGREDGAERAVDFRAGGCFGAFAMTVVFLRPS
jgi:hypothetical protein